MLKEATVEAAVPVSDLDLSRRFYEETLGLEPGGSHVDGVDVFYTLAGGTRLLLYPHPGPSYNAPAHTVAHFLVDDVGDTVADLGGRGVEFEEYDLPTLKTVEGVATIGNHHFAWFKDPDRNVLGIHD